MTKTVDLSKLPVTVQNDIREFERENGSLPDHSLQSVLDAYLRWNGIIGYTAQIFRILVATEESKS